MRLFVIRIVLVLCTGLIFPLCAKAQASCECVECPPDEIAVCHYESGVCKGKCIRIDPHASAREFTAELLTVVLEKTVSTRNLSAYDARKYIPVIDALLKSEGRRVEFTFERKSIEIGLSLTLSGKERLQEARRELEWKRRHSILGKKLSPIRNVPTIG